MEHICKTCKRNNCYGCGIQNNGLVTEKDVEDLLEGIRDQKISITRHREKSNKQLTLEKLFNVHKED